MSGETVIGRVQPAEPPRGMPGDITDELQRTPIWSDQMVAAAGIPIHDVPLVTVGGGLGSLALVEFLRAQRIASFKLPERLEVVAEMPLSPVGKILKRDLRERIAAMVEQESRG